jgi:hypothetical protein
MLWIKRNLFLVVFGVIALGLLGWSVMYFLGKRALNTQFETDLQAAKGQLEALYTKVPFPSPTNINLAKAELARVRQNINAAKQYFTPVPFEKVADKDFTVLLQNTIFDLQKRAQQSGIELPERDYAFSFKAQKNALTFAPGSFPTLPLQLAEIKAISDVVYESKINRVANIKRMRVTTDDPAGSADYHEYMISTNMATGTVSNPYEFTVHCFSGDLGKLLEGLYKSPYGFIVKSVAIEPAPEAPAPAPGAGRAPIPVQPQIQPPPARRDGAAPQPPGQLPGARPPPARAGSRPEALKTILIEKLLKATLLVEVVKPVK